MPHVQAELGQALAVEFVFATPPDVWWQSLRAHMLSVPVDDMFTSTKCPFHDHACAVASSTDATAASASSEKASQLLSAMHKFLHTPPKRLQVSKFMASRTVSLIAD